MYKNHNVVNPALENIFYIATYLGISIHEEKESTHWCSKFLNLSKFKN